MATSLSHNEAIPPLRRFYREQGRMPSYSEMAELYGFASKNAAYYLAGKLIEAGVLTKDSQGRLLPVGTRFGLPVMGYVQAGFPSPAEEELIDTLSIDEYLIERPEMSFMLKVTGDSMIEAGIQPEDVVIVERGQSPQNGNIVLAQVDGEWTLKYYQKRQGHVCLVPANPKYPVIQPTRELRVEGIIKAVIRKY
jgi:SOS regulatory protein LexA